MLTLVINSLKGRDRIADEIVLNSGNGNLHLDYDLVPGHYAPLGICYIWPVGPVINSLAWLITIIKSGSRFTGAARQHSFTRNLFSSLVRVH